MVFDEVFQPFIEQSPVSVMFRGTLERALCAERLDQIFEDHALAQYDRDLAFSSCAEMLGLVVVKTRKSVNAAYRTRRQDLAVSVQAVYKKLAGIEPRVSEALVRETAKDFAAVVDAMAAAQVGPLPGFDVRIIDGNHLQGTQHRLQELRRIGDAALPGHSLAVLDPQRELIEDVVLCRDGHANQKPLFALLLDKIQPRQCWLGDRDFCTQAFLFGVASRDAFSLVRQHGQLQPESLGARHELGRIETGVVYEEPMQLTFHNQTLDVRRITVKLDQPTRDKDTEIHLLSTLPSRVDGRRIAEAYRSRWRIEAAFHKLSTVLRCELNTLGYPQAALFGFALAVVMYNAVSLIMTALRHAHPPAAKSAPPAAKSAQAPTKTAKTAAPARKFSFYYVADEIAGVARGMAIVIPGPYWTAAFGRLTPKQMAARLLWLARQVKPEQFYQNPASVKKRKARRPIKHGGHVATQRLLDKRKPRKTRQQRQL